MITSRTDAVLLGTRADEYNTHAVACWDDGFRSMNALVCRAGGGGKDMRRRCDVF